MNKKILLFTTVLLLPVAASATPGEDGYGMPTDHRLEHLSKELQLSEEQKAKLEVIFKEQHDKFRAIHEESHARIKEVLSAEQASKWEAMKKQHQEQRHQRMQERRKPNPN